MGMLLLVFAVSASLALGVLVSYAICQGLFQVFKMHAISAARSRSHSASVQALLTQRN